MAKAKKKPVGRPTKFLEKYCQMLIEHMESGYSYESFAGVVDVDRDTLYHWEKIHPIFSDAKKKAFSKCLLWWDKLGVDNALNITESHQVGNSRTTKSVGLNTGNFVFQMKNRFNWTDKREEKIEQRTEFKFSYNLEDDE